LICDELLAEFIMSKKKGKVSKLNDVFEEIGLGSIDCPTSIHDAQLIADSEGSGIIFHERHEEHRTCGGKRRYGSRKDAERVKKHRLRTTTGNSGRLASYKCPACGGWHLISSR